MSSSVKSEYEFYRDPYFTLTSIPSSQLNSPASGCREHFQSRLFSSKHKMETNRAKKSEEGKTPNLRLFFAHFCPFCFFCFLLARCLRPCQITLPSDLKSAPFGFAHLFARLV